MRYFLMLLMLVTSTLMAQVRSDLETVRSFERRTKQLSAQIDAATTIQECADVRVSIEQLRLEYEDDRDLLDRSLYGGNYEERLERITGQLLVTEKRIGIIESQIVRIVELETQVRELSAKVADLTSENTQLLSDVERLAQNIRGLSESSVESGNMVDSLRGVIGRLQRGLRERDEMIFALVDSLFMQYDKDITTAGDVALQGIAIKLDRNNVVSGVITSIENNIRFLEQAELSGSDLTSILEEHARFSSQWRGIGPKLASIYVSKKRRAAELAGIDTLLARWSEKADQAQWRELNRAFTRNDLVPDQFGSGEDFIRSMNAFVDGQLSPETSSDQRDSIWARFDRMWTDEIADSWIPLLIRRENISQQDADALTAKIGVWKDEMTPTSPFVYALLFVAIVSLVAVLYGTVIRNKPPSVS